MLEIAKLEKIISAYEELGERMGDPAVLSDQKEYTRLAKEYSNQGPLALAAQKYVGDVRDLA
ncbi:MAG: peptide chain release factor 1, partial [Eggerthellaceae bacterium]|nr:peptide chain release factor 1 [Eggerthellaceae bacterium]